MSAPLTSRQAIWLVARREFIAQVRSRSFIIGILFTLVIVAVVGGVVAFVSSQTEGRSLGVTAQTAELRPVLEQLAELQDVSLQVVQIDDAAGRQQVSDGELDALLSGGAGSYQLLFDDAVDSTLQPLVATAVQQQTLSGALAEAGTNPAAVAAQAQVQVDTVQPVDPNRAQQLALALGGTVLLFMGLQYAAGVASGVVEEKQSRVVELLLATLRPSQLLTGKILGIGAAGLLTLLILSAVVGTAGVLFGLLTLPTAAAGMFAIVLLWYLIGFFLFASIYAALGSTVSRQEELQTLLVPVIFVLIIPFVLTANIVPNDPGNPIIAVMSFVPFLSQTVMPARFAMGAAAPWELAVSAVLAVVAIALVIRVAARIYQNSILRTGARVSLLEALRSR